MQSDSIKCQNRHLCKKVLFLTLEDFVFSNLQISCTNNEKAFTRIKETLPISPKHNYIGRAQAKGTFVNDVLLYLAYF